MSIIVSVDGVKVILRKKQKVRLLQPRVLLLLRIVTLLTKTGLF